MIDIPLWDRAKWRGVGFLCYEESPPILGLFFENTEAGEAIFRQWKDRFGDQDDQNILRITFVEGPIHGTDPGYNIRIGSNVPAILSAAKSRGEVINDTGVFYTSRIHRMNPPPGSPNLATFKRFYSIHKACFIAQVAPTKDGGVSVNPESLIAKSELYFRQVEDILEGDIDRDALLVRK